MPDASRVASILMAAKPKGVPLASVVLKSADQSGLDEAISADIQDASYAASLSYADALCSLQRGNTSWALVKLYYSTFYCMRSLLLMDGVVPFFNENYYLWDVKDSRVRKGGSSSHQWKWSSIRDIKRLSGWYYSQDATDAYEAVKALREDANYRMAFIDPIWHECLSQVSTFGIEKAFRTYRDDVSFLYTYLSDHVAVAYPTMLLTSTCSRFSQGGRSIDRDRMTHLRKIWPLKDKLPIV